jgi:hypothetical protein
MSDTEETQVEQVEAQPDAVVVETLPVRAWAEKAGHLPENLPGDKMHPVKFNRSAWLARAACARLGLTLDSLIDEKTYLETVAAVAAAEAR